MTFLNLLKGIFSVCGTVYEIEEAFMNAVISVNGSSPAYIYLLAKIVVDYATSRVFLPRLRFLFSAKL